MVISRANFLLDGKIPDSNVATHFDPLCTVLVYAYIHEECLKGDSRLNQIQATIPSLRIS